MNFGEGESKPMVAPAIGLREGAWTPLIADELAMDFMTVISRTVGSRKNGLDLESAELASQL